MALPRPAASRSLLVAGALAVVASVQWIVLVFVSQAYYQGYSITTNTLSDLGATCHNETAYTPNSCLIYQPSSIIFNTTLVLFGVLTVAAAYFANRSLRKRWFSILLGLFGLGQLIAGVFPENVEFAVHSLGALLAFVTGAIAAITVYRLRDATPRYFQYTSAALGIVSLVATLVFIIIPLSTLESSVLGAGGVERVIVYPLKIWEALFGAVFLAKNWMASVKR